MQTLWGHFLLFCTPTWPSHTWMQSKNGKVEQGVRWSKVSLTIQKAHLRRALISGFLSMKRLGVFLLPPGWDASPSQGCPQHFAGTYLYTWVERGTVRVKRLAQEHNTMSPARTRTRTTQFGVEHSNHEATAPPRTRCKLHLCRGVFVYIFALLA